jgi:UDP-N-acetylmuramyl pentapeptide synthase
MSPDDVLAALDSLYGYFTESEVLELGLVLETGRDVQALCIALARLANDRDEDWLEFGQSILDNL